LRYLFVASHYRSPLIYAEALLQQAQQSLARFYTALRGLPLPASTSLSTVPTSFKEDFITAMDDDFNTPIALSVLFALAHDIQRLREKGDIAAASEHAALLRELGGVLGLLQTDPDAFFQTGDSADVTRITALIEAREQARREKNWAEADRLRDELAALSIAIEDGAQGTTWKRMIK
jgi:cysteinyl-tRNA synthetase